MKLDEMLKALEDEAKEKGENILSDARAQVNGILEEAKRQGEKLANESHEAANQKLALEKAKVLSAANFEVKKQMLEAKEQVIEQLFTKLEEKAKQELSSDKDFLRRLAAEALAKFKGQKVKIMVNNDNTELAKEALSGLTASYQLQDGLTSIGGLKVISEDGRITVDNTIDGRLKKIRQVFEPEIIRNLFGDEE